MPDYFNDAYLPNIKAATITYKKWRTSYPGEATKWDAYLARAQAHKAGEPRPSAPTLTSRFGKQLVAAAELHVSVTDIGSVYDPPPEPPPPPAGHSWWADDSPLNTLIPASPTVLWNYAQGPFAGLSGIGFNHDGWAVAVFEDISGSRRTLTNPDGWKFDNVPMPAQFQAYWDSMNAIGDGEKHMVIVDSAVNRVHALYDCNRDFTLFGSGGEMRAKTVSRGIWDNRPGPWIGRASGFCPVSGAVIKAELDAGVCNHALVCGWPKASIRNTYVSPATSSDGSGTSTSLPPMGSRIQLDPTLTDAQILAYGITSYWLPMAHAMQNYGCYIVDSTSWMTIYAESWNDAGRVDFGAGWYPASANLVPHLRIVEAPAVPVYDDRNVFGQPHNP